MTFSRYFSFEGNTNLRLKKYAEPAWMQKMSLSRTCALEENIRNFATRLKNRGYPAATVEKHLSEVKFSERETSLTNRNRTAQKNILPFVTQYHRALLNSKERIMGKWHLIQNQPQLRNIFKEPPILSYRKGKSLKDILVKAKL